nr:MAG TPA: protein of unknown function (DUF4376) [Caudoviricetes sp.]
MVYNIINKETNEVVGQGNSNEIPKDDSFYRYEECTEIPTIDTSLANYMPKESYLEKKEKLNNIKVTLTKNELVFQGNEEAQNRLANKIVLMNTLKQKVTKWKMYDNQWKDVSLQELVEALSLAAEQTEKILKEYK